MNVTTIARDEIARRAYAIWEARGCPPGDGSEDWRAAELELSAERVARDGSTQTRLQSWWRRMRERVAGQDGRNCDIDRRPRSVSPTRSY